MQKIKFSLGLFFVASFSLVAQSVKFTGSPTSLISTTATIAEGKKLFYTSGLTANAQKPDLPDSDYEKFGNTYLQAKNILDRFDALLMEAGLKRNDVFSMRVFITPDTKTGKYDFDGWNKAYKEYYGTAENPNKPVRATYGIATLVSPTKFIEIEIIAAYP